MSLSRREFVKLSSFAPLAYAIPYPISLVDGIDFVPESADELFKLFQNPPAAARPFVRWWWNGCRVVESELLRELDLLKEKGISGVEINSIAFPANNEPMGYTPLTWLSAEWLEALKKTVTGAKKRGITCDIIVGSGWPFGGEFLKKEEQIKLLSLGTRVLKGNQKLSINKQELVNDMEFLRTYKEGSIELYEVRLVPATMTTFDAGKKIDISKDELTVEVPAGDHILYYLVKLVGYTSVTHGAPGASGPLLDHYNKPAVNRYLNHMSDAINKNVGPMGELFRSVFIDSLELRGSNWCDDLIGEFSTRRGYDLTPYLPYILFKINKASTYNGNQVLGGNDTVQFAPELNEEISRVRYDFETTRLELFDERFLQTFIEWCKQNKVKSRVQAYGREYYTLESAMKLDIPECETWLRSDVGTAEMNDNEFRNGRGYRPVNKFVASAAWLTNKRIVSCEEITNTSMVFNATLERIKVTGDQSNLSGVTHSILHGFNYSPKDIPFPGWVRYGTFFNERNTWWPYLRNWIDYKARLSAVFQNAEMQANIAVMFPSADMWSKVGLQYQQFPQIVQPKYANNIWEAINQNGGGCDYIDESILNKSTFQDGSLKFGPRTYSVLLMLEMESIATETAASLKKFAQTGGRVVFIGKDPNKTFGHLNHNGNDELISATIPSLKKTYPNNIISYKAPDEPIITWYAKMQQALSIPGFVKFDKPSTNVSQVYYKTEGADIFFISNYNLERSYEFTATFNIPNKTAWLWDPETGKKYLYPTDGAKNRLKIELDHAQSVLIVFSAQTKGERYPIREPFNLNPQKVLGSWSLILEKVYEKPRKIEIENLIDFKDIPELQSFAGVIWYEKTIELSNAEGYNYIDLGMVHGISEVELNGVKLGTKWYGKHIFGVKDSLKKGENKLRIKLTTVLGNYAKSLKDNKIAKQWIGKQPVQSLGMIGPVRLV